MAQLDHQDFDNQLVHFEIPYKTIEEQIKNFKLEFLPIKDKEVEWSMKLPIFVYSFYDLVIQNDKNVPTQIEFWKHYQNQNIDWFRNQELTHHKTEAIKARVFRTYPSLVRDLHFSNFLNDRIPETEVLYNVDLDVQAGIDLLIKVWGLVFGINLYTDTQRASIGRKKKKYRHDTYDNIINLDIPVNFKGSYQVGQFFLYAEREEDLIKQEINTYYEFRRKR